MGLLFVVSVMCCMMLLTLGGIVGYLVSRRPAPPVFRLVGSSTAAMARLPHPLFVHPRMDLASGLPPQNQTVDMEQRRHRQERSEASSGEHASQTAVAFEPFGERQKHSRSYRQRLDRAYALDSMGDLSDPVAGSVSRAKTAEPAK